MAIGTVARQAGRAVFANAYLLLALTALFWSGNHIIGRAAAGHVPPMGIATARWWVGALLLWPVAHQQIARDWPLIRSHWGILSFLAITGGALFGALQYLGLQYTSAMNVSVMNSLAPVLIPMVGALIFRDSLTTRQALGIAASLAGALAIVTRMDPAALTGLVFNVGDLIIVFNMAVFAVYSAYLRRRPPIHWLSLIFVMSVVSAVATAPLYAWEHLSGFAFQATRQTFWTLLYVTTLPSVVAFVFWNRGVELIGATRAGVFLHLVPLFSALLATLFLGERLMLFHVVGLGLILTGVKLATHR